MNEEQLDEDGLKDVTPWDAGLKRPERLFVLEMCESDKFFLDPWKAYQELHPDISPESAKKAVKRMWAKGKVPRALQRLLMEQQPEKDQIDVYKILQEAEQMAFFNPADIIDNEGRLKKPISELGDLAKCIKNIKPSKNGPIVELEDRYKYVELLCKYLNIVRQENLAEVTLQVVEVAPKVTGNGLIDAVDAWNAVAAKEN